MLFDLNTLCNEQEISALNWLWENHRELERRFQEQDYLFDYPDYGGMPEDLSATLYGDLVDWVQESTQLGFPTTQQNFMRQALKHQL